MHIHSYGWNRGENTIVFCSRRDFAQKAKSRGGTLKAFDRSSQGLKECKKKCQHLRLTSLLRLCLEPYLNFQSLFMAAFSTDLVAIFNEEQSLLLRKLFSGPLCMRGRRPRSKCNGWEEKQEMAKIGLLCIVTAAWISGHKGERRINLHELISFARNSHDRPSIVKDFTVVHFHQTKKHLWTFKAPILLAEPWRSVTEYLQH